MESSSSKGKKKVSFEDSTKFYQSKIEQSIFDTNKALEHWCNYEKDYEALKSTLKVLNKETEHNVMVPISKFAFMPGKLVHTNEILVLLGDNWFVERSAYQAIGIVDRRIEKVLNFPSKKQILNEEGLPFVDIVEEYHSDEEKESTKKPTKKVKFEKDVKSGYYDLKFLDKFIEEEEEELKLIKEIVVEKDFKSEVGLDELENQFWMKEIASEYHQKRLDIIAKEGGLLKEKNELSPSVNQVRQEQNQQELQPPVTEKVEKPKKISRFKAARIQGKLE
ncbi:7530_t:CDS:2 [Entrophospora sp. SA101]|nr:13003_t:CDS:2 [Entrophospora sp. SA101]CAJ0745748.1 10146_t:CDS:2 [Entrophospora sp. SA101]CAJ0754082.1 24487_t:CDS:2 [Entrophospora sp. SA101]CAJ0754198.1 22197_t:CDS:2 [Entrophospora sp. SA101]CAJ0761695.1 2370_t:CDS:2 [Entrophospora sp. SA101]